MGGCGWFERCVGFRSKKASRHKKVKPKQDSKIANCRDASVRETSFRAGSTRVIGRSTGTREFAATRIQTAYRSYRARKLLRCMKGTSKFQVLSNADALTQQSSSALDIIHCWSKIQMEIRTRRHWMVAEGRIKQKKRENQGKTESKLHELEVEWTTGPETLEEVISRIQHREEATYKRERAMAYAFNHYWRPSSNQYFGQAYYDLSKDSWGWSWKERWIAVCPWEARVIARPKQKNKTSKKPKNGAPKQVVAVKPKKGYGKGTIKGTYGNYWH
ncbi:IQ motif, EF-hand binding site [Artemisia annua]|uniref:IQ motif, EF-hand binding site n=1 Tax=Artemisia annua TaxID=35608 RepID=A0A2U1KKM4_ARTAN|nr:IQ motif, EF-hand binding site [Artemisia annua]